ncbi:MAG: hypothetical protein IJ396_07705 [Oscillibacter sp.]|nr:hypothetical protein [Oscillibacter sp.]MBQ7778781.1 hypothetical protein [Oscillibacter sp.]
MIIFNNWQITISGVIAQQYDHMTRKIEVVGDLPAEYAWSLLVECGDNKDTLALARTASGAYTYLTKDNLSVAGYYKLQLRGNLIEDVSKTRHTNQVQAYIPASLTGVGEWPAMPSEFAQIEQRLLNINTHPPIPGDDGFWHLWDGEAYVKSELVVPVDPNGYSLYYSSEHMSAKIPEMSLASVQLNGKTLRGGDFVLTVNGCIYRVARIKDDSVFLAYLCCSLRGTRIYTTSESRTQTNTSLTRSAIELGENVLYRGDFILAANGYLYEVKQDFTTESTTISATLRCVLKGDPGNVLTAPDGTRYELGVDNAGNLTTTKLS